MTDRPVRRQDGHWGWEGVEQLNYKAEGSAPFSGITRQVLFQNPALGCELRYFEIQPHGYSTLERHEHAHAVMIQRGAGRVLVADQIHDVGAHDLVHIPAFAWHQFRAGGDAPFGFLCMVNTVRDRPQLPTAEDLQRLKADPLVAAFIAV
ncbi:MAG: cupin domain-containing protein [Rhodocyclaceae bacterium]